MSLAGTGKTTLAAAVACSPDTLKHFDDVLWVTAGRGTGVAELALSAAALLRELSAAGKASSRHARLSYKTSFFALGVSATPEDLDDAAAAEDGIALLENLRCVLEDRRVLLIVDDLWPDTSSDESAAGSAVAATAEPGGVAASSSLSTGRPMLRQADRRHFGGSKRDLLLMKYAPASDLFFNALAALVPRHGRSCVLLTTREPARFASAVRDALPGVAGGESSVAAIDVPPLPADDAVELLEFTAGIKGLDVPTQLLSELIDQSGRSVLAVQVTKGPRR